MEAQLNHMFTEKKRLNKDLPSIIRESKALQAEVEESRKHQEVKIGNLEDLDKQIEKLNEKRKKDQDEIDALRKSKNAV